MIMVRKGKGKKTRATSAAAMVPSSMGSQLELIQT